MTPSRGRHSSFVVVAAAGRRTAALDGRQVGHQREQVVVKDRCRDATVVYAGDLGRAQSIASTLRQAGDDFVLLDLHVVVAASVTELRRICAAQTDREAQPENRLVYCGTEAGVASYLADLARLGMADGVVISCNRPGGSDGEGQEQDGENRFRG